ncbi:MAG: hypothetical protein ACRELB_10755 [Polyangiaceae bacterium]
MKPLIALPLLVAPLALMACGNEYHPEYHPVTVTSYEQHVAYPAGATSGAQPPPVVFSAPPPPPPPAPEPWSAWPSE